MKVLVFTIIIFWITSGYGETTYYLGGNAGFQRNFQENASTNLFFNPYLLMQLQGGIALEPMVVLQYNTNEFATGTSTMAGANAGVIAPLANDYLALATLGGGLAMSTYNSDYGDFSTGYFLNIKTGFKIRVLENGYIDITPQYMYRNVEHNTSKYLVILIGVTIRLN